MEVAGQWRREWAGTAEYGKVSPAWAPWILNQFINLTNKATFGFTSG